mgnify:CR=1 FL=1
MPKSTSQPPIKDLKNTLDDRILHPWQYLEYRGEDDRTFIDKSEGIYLYDKTGKKLIDGPGGMWCNNIGHGNKEIGEAVKNQLEKMEYCSPFSESSEISAELASVLSELSPGDLNTVFFTTDGSTANDTALRFIMFYNNTVSVPSFSTCMSDSSTCCCHNFSSCRRCNNRKADHVPEEVNMELLAVPFVPNQYEFLYLSNHNVLADQMEFLSARFSRHIKLS